MDGCCAYQRQQHLLAVGRQAEIAVFSAASLKLLWRCPEEGCCSIAWHPTGATFAAACTAGRSLGGLVLIFTAGCAGEGHDDQWVWRCVHRFQPSASDALSAGLQSALGLCFAPEHLLVAGKELSVWHCTFSASSGTAPHFVHCSDEPDLQSSLEPMGAVRWMELDDSQRFLATLAEDGTSAGASDSVSIWFALEGGVANANAANSAAAGGSNEQAPEVAQLQPHSDPVIAAEVPSGLAELVRREEIHLPAAVLAAQWCPSWHSCGQRLPARLATLAADGDIALWRENSLEEKLHFQLEARFAPADLWHQMWVSQLLAREILPTDLPVSFVWALDMSSDWSTVEADYKAAAATALHLPKVEWLGGGMPLHLSGHKGSEANFALLAGGTPLAKLVVLWFDGSIALLELGPATGVRVSALAAALPQRDCQQQLVRLCAARHRRSDKAYEVSSHSGTWLELWLHGGHTSGIRCASVRRDQTIAMTASASQLPGSQMEPQPHPLLDGGDDKEESGRGEDAPKSLKVKHVAIHPLWAYAACLLQVEGESTASRVWVAEAPMCRATHHSGHDLYSAPEGAWQDAGLFTACLQGLQSICWAPGRAVPPVLLGVRSEAAELLACSIDVIRGADSAAASWTPVRSHLDGLVVTGVEALAVVHEGDDERAALCMLIQGKNGVSFFLAKFFESPGGLSSPVIVPILQHCPERQWSTCFSVEWLATTMVFCADAPQERTSIQASRTPSKASAVHDILELQQGDIVGQVAVWCPEAATHSGEIQVWPLQVELQAAEAQENASEAARRQPQVAVGTAVCTAKLQEETLGLPLDILVRDEWLYALTSEASVVIWSLCEDRGYVQHIVPMATNPVQKRIAEKPQSSTQLFRPWNGLVGQAKMTKPVASGAGSRDRSVKVGLKSGYLRPQAFATGAMGFLVAGRSDEEEVVPTFLVYFKSLSEGDTCRVVDLRLNALPLQADAVCWTTDGAILCAGTQAAARSSQGLSLLGFGLTEEVLSWLQTSTPCPAYHPSIMSTLMRSGRSQLTQSVLQRLTKAAMEQHDGAKHAMMDAVQAHMSPSLGIPLLELATSDIPGEEGNQGLQAVATAPETETAAALFDSPRITSSQQASELGTSGDWWADLSNRNVQAATEAASTAANAEVKLSAADLEALTGYLQTRPLPLLQPEEQAVLLTMASSAASNSQGSNLDLDDSAQRYMQAFLLQAALDKQNRRYGGSIPSEHAISSEDICWAFHSGCQSTLADKILECLGSDLEWKSLCKAGVGLWLTDPGAIRKVLEALPRSIIKKQGKEIDPQAVALWYALLGRRSILAVLYKQQKQERIAEFLANDLREEPYREKARKNAFELVRQRRYELGCAFFILAGLAEEAIDVCVRYLDDWSLAAVIAQQIQATMEDLAATASEAFRRVLLADLVPQARKAHDPWLASLAYSRAGEHGAAMQCCSPPYLIPVLATDTEECGGGEAQDHATVSSSSDESSARSAEPIPFFSGDALRHAGLSPALPSFSRLLHDTILRKRLHLGKVDQLPAAATYLEGASFEARAYLARRQPLLSIPREGKASLLSWRTLVAIGRGMAAMFISHQHFQLRGDVSTVFAELVHNFKLRLGLSNSLALAIVSAATTSLWLENSGSTQDKSAEWILESISAFYFSMSNANGGMASEASPLLSAVREKGSPDAMSADHYQSELAHCLCLQRLARTQCTRGLSVEDHSASSRRLAAIMWHSLPQLSAFLQDPEHVVMPVISMYLTTHLLCSPVVSRVPASVLLGSDSSPSQPPEFAPDLVHALTALALVLTTLLAVWSATSSLQLWNPLQSQADDAHAFARAGTSLWQSLRVLLEHIQGDASEQRRLHRSGALASLLVSLFLQPSSSKAEDDSRGSCQHDGAPMLPSRNVKSSPGDLVHPSGLKRWVAQDGHEAGGSTNAAKASGTQPPQAEEDLRRLCIQAARDESFAMQMRSLLHALLVELILECLATALQSVSRKAPSSSKSMANLQAAAAEGHWLSAWHARLLSSLRRFLCRSVRRRARESALECLRSFPQLPLALCATDGLLNTAIADLAGGQEVAALWFRLGGGHRLRVLLAHHPRLLSPGLQLPRRSSLLCRAGAGQLRFLCGDASNTSRLALHARGHTREMNIGHAARWFELRPDDEEENPFFLGHTGIQRTFAIAERYSAEALTGVRNGAELGSGLPSMPNFDPTSEFLLGGLCAEVASHPAAEDRGEDVAHFLRSLGLAAEPVGLGQHSPDNSADSSLQHRGPMLCAASHPCQPIYATSAEDGSSHLWSFGTPGRPYRCLLSKPSEEAPAETRRSRLQAGIASLSSAVAARTAAAVALGSPADLMQGVLGGVASPRDSASPRELSPARERGEQRHNSLVWNSFGNRLLGVGTSSTLTLWDIGDGNGTSAASTLTTGVAQSKVACGAFVSHSSLVAVGGRRAEPDVLPSAWPGSGGTSSSAVAMQKWPFISAGLCVVDALCPPPAALVMHDAYADPITSAPAEYSCLTWAPARQEIICGLKSGELRIFDMRQQRVSQRFPAHQAAVRHAFVVASGRIATLSAAAELKVWSLQDYSCLETRPRLHALSGVSRVIGKAQALACATMVSEHHLVTGGQDGLVLLTRI